MNIASLKKENDELIEKALKICYENNIFGMEWYKSFNELLDKYQNYEINTTILVYDENDIIDFSADPYYNHIGQTEYEISFCHKNKKHEKEIHYFDNLFDFDDNYYISIISHIDRNELIDLKLDFYFIEKCNLTNKIYMDLLI